jgi:rhamnogalacturonyl hydrolase YesR
MLTRATGNSKYLEIMQASFDDVTAQLWDEQLGLYYRDDRFKEQFTANGKKIFWSRGKGWVFAGIPRILDYLPADHPRRARYVGISAAWRQS